MRSFRFLVVAFLASTLAGAAVPQARPLAASEDNISVWFSPDGGCTEAIVARLNAAKQTIDMQAYSFTSTAIAKALGEAKERGVKIRAVLDKSQQTEKYSGASYLVDHGIPTFIDAKHAIAHNKIMIIDGATLVTGSFNFTSAAEKSNAENLLIIDGKTKLVAAYQKNFESHLGHSKPYERKAKN